MSRLGRTLGAIVVILTLPTVAAAQPPGPPPVATGTGIIVGQVVDAATGKGVGSVRRDRQVVADGVLTAFRRGPRRTSYHASRRTPGTASKCSSRLRTGRRCSSARAAIQASLAGIGRPSFFSDRRTRA